MFFHLAVTSTLLSRGIGCITRLRGARFAIRASSSRIEGLILRHASLSASRPPSRRDGFLNQSLGHGSCQAVDLTSSPLMRFFSSPNVEHAGEMLTTRVGGACDGARGFPGHRNPDLMRHWVPMPGSGAPKAGTLRKRGNRAHTIQGLVLGGSRRFRRQQPDNDLDRPFRAPRFLASRVIVLVLTPSSATSRALRPYVSWQASEGAFRPRHALRCFGLQLIYSVLILPPFRQSLHEGGDKMRSHHPRMPHAAARAFDPSNSRHSGSAPRTF